MLTEELRKRIADIIRSVVEPEKIIIFGSYARGDAGPDSDLDILVIVAVDGLKHNTAAKIHSALADMEISKDVVVVRPEEFGRFSDVPGSVVYDAAKEGILVYGG